MYGSFGSSLSLDLSILHYYYHCGNKAEMYQSNSTKQLWNNFDVHRQTDRQRQIDGDLHGGINATDLPCNEVPNIIISTYSLSVNLVVI